jgi:hypothetical protein
MVDMGVRDEDVLKPLYLARRQNRDIAQVEQDRPPFEQGLNVKGRVSGPAVDEAWMQKRPHGSLQPPFGKTAKS